MYAGAGQISRQRSRENTAAFHASNTSSTSNTVERIAAALSRSPSP